MKKPLFAMLNQIVAVLSSLAFIDIIIALITLNPFFLYGYFALVILTVIISTVADWLEIRFLTGKEAPHESNDLF